MVRRTCVKCETALPRSETGRPRRFCSVGCRRATEFELRRLQRQLSDAEEAIRSWSSEAAVAPVKAFPPFVRSKAQCEWQAKGWEDQRVALEHRMRALLDDEAAQ